MIFIETPVFTEEILLYLTGEEYKELQNILIVHPESGSIIPGSNGLRKIRWKIKGIGKRGGLRVISYWDVPHDTIYMLLPYRKSVQEDLSKEATRFLANLIKEYLK